MNCTNYSNCVSLIVGQLMDSYSEVRKRSVTGNRFLRKKSVSSDSKSPLPLFIDSFDENSVC